MSAEPEHRPPFYCPACGKKHRADLSALQDRSDATARLTCARCDTVMGLSLGSDGLPTCEILEPPSTQSDAAAAATGAPTGAALPGEAMSKPSMSLSLLAAAVVAAAVSFGVGQLTGGDGPAAAGPSTASFTALQGRFAKLESELATQRDATRDALAALAKAQENAAGAPAAALASIEAGVRANAAKVTGLEKSQGSITEAFEGIKSNYKELNGRIEGNYVALRGLTKRLKMLESK